MGSPSPAARESGSSAAIPNLCLAQWERLVNLIGTDDSPSGSDRLMGKPPNSSWILDIGATVHATRTLACLTDSYEGPSSPVTLPDGGVITSTRR